MPVRLRKLIGSRSFYMMVLSVVLPIIVQNAISNFVNLLDNLMVGRTNTDPMSGVAIANQLIFVFSLAVFGAVSGAGIFTAQFQGAGNTEGVRESFRYKLYIALILTSIATALFLLFDTPLISLYLKDASDPERVERTLYYAKAYMRIMLLGLLPFAIAQCYASTLRECGETKLPMFAGIIAVLVNLLFNYLLIFGKFGFPCLGVEGAAWATVLSRYVEVAIIVLYTHLHPQRFLFARGLYSKLSIPKRLIRSITIKGMPLLANELLWSLGMATLNQIYSLRGLDVVAATNISSTVYNLFSVVYISMGSASAIIVGQALGANRSDTALDHSCKLLTLSLFFSIIIAVILAIVSPFVPLLYKTSSSVHELSSQLIRVCCLMMPCTALIHTSYFVLRSGGKTLITFFFDCVYLWCCNIPVAYVLAHHTALPIITLFLFVQLTDLIKCGIGLMLIRKGIWINNIVSDK